MGTEIKLDNRKLWYFPLIVLAVCECFFFRNFYGTGLLFGDKGDGRLTMLIAEHWFRVFQGKAGIADLGMFYPAKNTLAYSDMLFGYGLIHSLFRMFGLDVYLAYKYTLLFVHAAGTFGCYYLLRKEAKTGVICAMTGTAAFSFADNYLNSMIHTQLCAVAFVPFAIIFCIRFFRFIHKRRQRNASAMLFISIMMLILYTSWYTAFFSALFVVIGCLTGLVYCAFRKIRIWKHVVGFFNEVRFDFAGYLIYAAAALIPFAALEMPLLKMSGGYGFDQLKEFIPEAVDVIRVSRFNLLFGFLFRDFINVGNRGLSGEVTHGCGFSIIIIGLSLFMLLRSFLAENKSTHEMSMPAQGNTICIKRHMARVGLIAVYASILLTVYWQPSGICGWSLVNRFFPGGRSIRAVARYLTFLSLPLAVCTAALWEPDMKKSRTGVVFGAVLLACVYKGGVRGYWNRADSLERLNKVAVPPKECEVFYLEHASQEEMLPFIQLDACEIASCYGLQTMNGYSGLMPLNWGLWNVDGEGYHEAADAWIKQNNLKDVYVYMQKEDQWLLHETIAAE